MTSALENDQMTVGTPRRVGEALSAPRNGSHDDAQRRMRVLLCDDHILFLDALAVVLRAAGHVPAVLVADPRSAVKAACADGVIDVCVFDACTDVDAVIDAIEELRRLFPGLPVVMVTDSPDPLVAARAIDVGANAVVHKTDEVKRIVHAIERVVAGEFLINPALIRQAMHVRRDNESRPSRPLIGHLTPRERLVLERLVAGDTTDSIATRLGISRTTTRGYVQAVLMKLGVHSRLEAVAFALRYSIVTLGRDERPGTAVGI